MELDTIQALGAVKGAIWGRIQKGNWASPKQAIAALWVYEHLDKALALCNEELAQFALPLTPEE